MKVDIESLKTRSPYKDYFPIDKNAVNKKLTIIEKNGSNQDEPIIYSYVKNVGYVVIYGHIVLEAAKLAGLINVEATRIDFDDEEQALKYALDKQADETKLTKPSSNNKAEHTTIEESAETEEEYIERRSRDYAKQIGDQLRLAGFDSDQIKYVLSIVEV